MMRLDAFARDTIHKKKKKKGKVLMLTSYHQQMNNSEHKLIAFIKTIKYAQ